MRDVQQVLERWGNWSHTAENGYSPIAAGFKGLLPPSQSSRPTCTDKDALIVDGCMARLQQNNPEIYMLLVDYYRDRHTFMSLARKYHCSDTHIGKKLQKAEGVVEGMLMMLDVSMDMDKFVQREPAVRKISA